jgi:hypothetical protein
MQRDIARITSGPISATSDRPTERVSYVIVAAPFTDG